MILFPQSCYNTCYQKYVVQKCECGDPQYPLEGQVFGEAEVIPCNIRNETQGKNLKCYQNCNKNNTNFHLSPTSITW